MQPTQHAYAAHYFWDGRPAQLRPKVNPSLSVGELLLRTSVWHPADRAAGQLAGDCICQNSIERRKRAEGTGSGHFGASCKRWQRRRRVAGQLQIYVSLSLSLSLSKEKHCRIEAE